MKKLITVLLLLIFYCCIINTSYASLPTPNTVYPSCGATNVPVPITFQWTTSNGATWYHFQILLGINTVVDSNFINLTNVTISNLLANTQYSWRVKAMSGNDSSNWSPGPCYFTTSGIVPAPPVLVSPPNGAVNVSLTPLFVWHHSLNATTYHIQVALDPGFGSPSINIPSISDTFYQVTTANQLAPGTEYWWRVSGSNSNGQEGSFSGSWNFSTIPPLPIAPNLHLPINGANGISVVPTLQWYAASGATSYHVRVWGAIDTSIYNFVYDATTDSLQNTIPYALQLLGNHTYYWVVWGINISGPGPASAMWNFTTLTAPPPPPLLYSPPNGSSCVSRAPLLQWQNIGGATSYRVQVSTDSSFGSMAINTVTFTNQYQVPFNFLGTNTKYYWRSNATNAGGTGNWSTVWNFTTIPPNPGPVNLLSPTNNATNVSLTPILAWSHGANASFYRLQVSTNQNFTGTLVLDLNNLSDTIYSISSGTLNGCGNYYWRVYSCNCALPNGVVSNPTFFHFSTLSTINLSLRVLLEGFYNGSSMVQDTIRVFLANANSPHAFVDTNRAFLSTQGTDTVSFTHAPSGNYYIVIRHRNHLETWSSTSTSFAPCSYTPYDFTTSSSKAYGNNMKQVGSVWVLYGGDINQDNTIDAADYNYYKTEYGKDGYRPSDLNGDNWIDGYDLPILYSNFGHSVISPP